MPHLTAHAMDGGALDAASDAADSDSRIERLLRETRDYPSPPPGVVARAKSLYRERAAPKVGGYNWRQAITEARRDNETARHAIERVISEDLGTAAKTVLLAKAALALGSQLQVLREIEEIAARDSATYTYPER